jgi:branched-chain amino acid transport system permease protein
MEPITIRQNGTAHWAIRIVGLALIAAVLIYVPTKMSDPRIDLATDMLIYAIAAISLNLVLGYGGQISIGQSAFFGVGVYTTAILIVDHGWSPLLTIPIAVVLAFVAGCLVALPALRFKGVYLALITLALAVLLPQLLKWQKLAWLTNGTRGIDGATYKGKMKWPILGELRGEEKKVFFYWLAVLVLILAFLICRGIVRSRVGRSLIAIRDNETAAAVMGVNLTLTKTLMFGVGAAIVAAAGSVSVMRTGVATPDTLNLTLFGAIIFLLVMFLGGAASLWGPIAGAVVYSWVDNVTRNAGAEKEGPVGALFGWANQSPATLILAAVIIIVVFLAPHGIVGLLKQLARKIVVVVPDSVGTSAPASPAPTGDVVPQATT